MQLVQDVQKFMNKIGEPEQFQGRIIFMSMFNDIIWGIEDNETERIVNSTLVSLFARRFPAGHWSFLGLGSETKWYSSHKERQSKGGGKLSAHICADGDIIETVFCTIISVNQLSIYGAVSDLCEEYSSCQTRTCRLVWAEQSDPLFAPADLLITTPTLSIVIPAQENLLQKHKERVEKLPKPDRSIKICTDAECPKTVEVGQCFMTKHTDEFLQFAEPVTCREYTLPRDERSTDPKGWIRGNTKIGPVLEVPTSYLQGGCGVEIRIESVNKDNSHSWVCFSRGLNKLVTHLIDKKHDDNEQETSTTKTEVFACASRSKAKATPPSTTCSSSRTVHFLKEIELILNQELNSIKRTQWQKE